MVQLPAFRIWSCHTTTTILYKVFAVSIFKAIDILPLYLLPIFSHQSTMSIVSLFCWFSQLLLVSDAEYSSS